MLIPIPEAEGHVAESAVAVVVIEIAGVVGEIGFEDVEPAVAVVVRDGNAHTGLLVAILAVGAAGDHGDIGERAVVIVVKQNAGLGIDGDVNIRPAVVIEIVRDRGDGIARAGFQDAGFLRDIGESSVAVVVIENVGVAGETARAAHDRNSFPLAKRLARGRRSFCGIELDVVADEKIQMAVAIVIEPGAARAPADLLVVDAGFARDIGERAVAVVVKQNVVSPEAAEQIVPAIVVVVADADAGLPAGARQSGFFGDVGERAVAIVFVKMRSGSLAGGPIGDRSAFRWSDRCRASRRGRNRRRRSRCPWLR